MDSLDDIYCLQESRPHERAHLLPLLEDTHLHALLEVSNQYFPVKSESFVGKTLLFIIEQNTVLLFI